jgi:hypothetical protein
MSLSRYCLDGDGGLILLVEGLATRDELTSQDGPLQGCDLEGE